MNKDFILSISRNREPFLNEAQENLYDSLFPNDSYMNLEEQDYLVEPILPLLEEIERKSQKNIKKKSNDDEFSSNRLQFLVERKYINKKFLSVSFGEGCLRFHHITRPKACAIWKLTFFRPCDMVKP